MNYWTKNFSIYSIKYQNEAMQLAKKWEKYKHFWIGEWQVECKKESITQTKKEDK